MQLNEMLVDAFRLDLFIKLIGAVLVGGGIGLERELAGKPAGLRTNILICIGSTLLMDLSMGLAENHGGDPGRIAAQVVTGIGFIGAGTILHTRGNVTGLTSAATIWVVAAIGMTIGAGFFVEALGTTVAVMLVLVGLGWVERKYLREFAENGEGRDGNADDRRRRGDARDARDARRGRDEGSATDAKGP
jgi:putative Mg2+ transporter-C (MgtC) family protein